MNLINFIVYVFIFVIIVMIVAFLATQKEEVTKKKNKEKVQVIPITVNESELKELGEEPWLATGKLLVKACINPWYQEIKDSRKYKDLPEIQEVFKLINSCKFDKAEKFIKKLLLSYPDLDHTYRAKACINKKRENLLEEREVLLTGLKYSKRKYNLFWDLGDNAFELSNFNEALFFFSQSILGLIKTADFKTWGPIQFFGHISEFIGMTKESEKFFNLEDQFNPGKIRLIAEAQNKLRMMVKKYNDQNILKEIITNLSKKLNAKFMEVPNGYKMVKCPKCGNLSYTPESIIGSGLITICNICGEDYKT